MTITIRPMREADFFAWLPLFEGYSTFYDTELNDVKALTVWQWIIDGSDSLNGIVAVDENDELVGFAHYSVVARTLAATKGLYLDDLFTAESHRGQGVGRALIEHLEQLALTKNYSLVRWITAADNKRAQRLYDSVAQRTEWLTYDLEPGNRP